MSFYEFYQIIIYMTFYEFYQNLRIHITFNYCMISDNTAKQNSKSRSPTPIHKTNRSLEDIKNNLRNMCFIIFFIYIELGSYINFYSASIIYFNVYCIISKLMKIPLTDSRYFKYCLFILFIHLLIYFFFLQNFDGAINCLFFATILFAVIEFFVYICTYQLKEKKN